MEVFFRNDDVDTLDQELKNFMSIFESEGVPLVMAVEPANVTRETVQWLKQKKSEKEKAVSIIQHGYDHQDRIPGKGEFGGRTYEDQYQDIKKGKELMEDFFGLMFFPAFTCPNAGHNHFTILCLNDLGFKVFTSYHSVYYGKTIFYKVGRLMRQTHLFGKRISYHMMKIPGTELFDVSMSMNPIKEYLSIQRCRFNSFEFLKRRFRQIRKTGQSILGVTLHHRYHREPEDLRLVTDFLAFLKRESVRFTDIETIYGEAVGK